MSLKTDLILSRAPAAAFVSMGLFWGAFAALAPMIKAQIGAGDAEFGTALLFSALGACCAMLMAPIAERALGQWAMVVLALALASAWLLPGLATTVWFFGFAMMLAAMSSGTLDVVMNARLSQIEADSGVGLMNLNHALFSFAYAGAALGAGAGREAGWSAFAILSCACVLAVMLSTMMRAPTSEAEDETSGTAKLPGLLIWSAGAIILIAFMSEQATEGWSALRLERDLGGGAAQGALGPAILGLTMGIGRLSGQYLQRRFSAEIVIRWAGIMAATGAWIAAFAPNLGVAYAGFAVLGLGVSVTAPMAFALVGRRVANRHRAAAISRISVIGYAGFFIGPPLMGFLAEWFSLAASFAAIGVALLVLALPLVSLLKRS